MSAFCATPVRSPCSITPHARGLSLGLKRCHVARPPRFVVRAEDEERSPLAGAGRKFITREEEPEEYWTSKSERDGASPMGDPMAWVGLLGIFFPFVILGIAIASGYVELP